VPSGITLQEVVVQQFQMLSFHSTLTATHPYSSPWYTWPLILRPLWLYVSVLPANAVSTIVAMGNPALWWLGIAAIALCTHRFYQRRDLPSMFLTVLFLSQWLPYALISRPLFIYHYFINVPILCIATAFLLSALWETRGMKPVVVTYLVASVLLFIIFYPVISGNPVSRVFVDSLRWFHSWVF
jgi:dolichyl-phosphate-mannose--protein O-mannosyl transferase